MQKDYPLYIMQKKIYDYYRIYPNDSSYKMQVLFRLSGEINYKKLILSIEKVLNYNEIFKVNFILKNTVLQHYDSNRICRVNLININHIENDTNKIKYVLNDVNIKCSTPMNLANWPITQVYLYTSKTVNFLYLASHHIIMDTISCFQCFKEVSDIYNNIQNLNLKKTSYFNLANIKIKENRYNQAVNFFKKEFETINSLSMPIINTSRNLNRIINGRSIDFKIQKNSTFNICKKFNSTEFQILLAVYALILKSINNTNIFVVGIPVANRNIAFKSTIGQYINTLPLIFNFNKIYTFNDLIHFIKIKMFNLLKYQNFDIDSNMHYLTNNKSIINSSINNVFTFYNKQFTLNLNKITTKRYHLNENQLKVPLVIGIENISSNYLIHVQHTEKFNNINFGNIFSDILKKIEENSSINSLQEISCDVYTSYIESKLNKSKINFDLDNNTKINKNEFKMNKFENSSNLSIENKILSIWITAINNDKITINDRFFDVGGTSILLLKVYSKILDEFNLKESDLSIVDLFNLTTPIDIASQIENLINKK